MSEELKEALEIAANLSQILGSILLAPLLTVITWLVTRERFAEFWRRRRWVLRSLAGLISVAVGMLWLGWWAKLFGWFGQTVTWQRWMLTLYSLGMIALPFAVLGAALLVCSRRKPASRRPQSLSGGFYTTGTFEWPINDATDLPDLPPWCRKCRMPMRRVSEAGPLMPIEEWECRRCPNKLVWHSDTRGDLVEDVRARYVGEWRREVEGQQSRRL
jgi:hypothetical protein